MGSTRMDWRPATVALVAAALALGWGPVEAAAGNVTGERVAADSAGDNWLVKGGSFAQAQFSPLTDINDHNVGRLGLAWLAEIDSPAGLASEPLVVDGVIYLSAPRSRVYAIDGATGKIRWIYDPRAPLGLSLEGSSDARTNRGVAVWAGKVYVGTPDCRLVAIDAERGTEVWQARVCDAGQAGVSGAPRVASGKVFIGHSGADSHVRGSIAAFDAQTGKEAVALLDRPGRSGEGLRDQDREVRGQDLVGRGMVEAGRRNGLGPHHLRRDHGAAALWDFEGVPRGYANRADGAARREALLGVHRRGAGRYRRIRLAPPDEHPGAPDRELPHRARRPADRRPRPARGDERGPERHLLRARCGHRGAPERDAARAAGLPEGTRRLGAQPDGLSRRRARRRRGLQGRMLRRAQLVADELQPGREARLHPDHGPAAGPPVPGSLPMVGRLLAWDPVARAARWSVENPVIVNSGVLSTAGNLVFQGQGTGEFAAYAGDSGRTLWSLQDRLGHRQRAGDLSRRRRAVRHRRHRVGIGVPAVRHCLDDLDARVPLWTRAAARVQGRRDDAVPLPEDPSSRGAPTARANLFERAVRRGEELAGDFGCTGCHSPRLEGSGRWVTDGGVPDFATPRPMCTAIGMRSCSVARTGTRACFRSRRRSRFPRRRR